MGGERILDDSVVNEITAGLDKSRAPNQDHNTSLIDSNLHARGGGSSNLTKGKLTRRDFLRLSSLGAAGAALAACTPPPDGTPSPQVEPTKSTGEAKPTIVAGEQVTDVPAVKESTPTPLVFETPAATVENYPVSFNPPLESTPAIEKGEQDITLEERVIALRTVYKKDLGIPPTQEEILGNTTEEAYAKLEAHMKQFHPSLEVKKVVSESGRVLVYSKETAKSGNVAIFWNTVNGQAGYDMPNLGPYDDVGVFEVPNKNKPVWFFGEDGRWCLAAFDEKPDQNGNPIGVTSFFHVKGAMPETHSEAHWIPADMAAILRRISIDAANAGSQLDIVHGAENSIFEITTAQGEKYPLYEYGRHDQDNRDTYWKRRYNAKTPNMNHVKQMGHMAVLAREGESTDQLALQIGRKEGEATFNTPSKIFGHPFSEEKVFTGLSLLSEQMTITKREGDNITFDELSCQWAPCIQEGDTNFDPKLQKDFVFTIDAFNPHYDNHKLTHVFKVSKTIQTVFQNSLARVGGPACMPFEEVATRLQSGESFDKVEMLVVYPSGFDENALQEIKDNPNISEAEREELLAIIDYYTNGDNEPYGAGRDSRTTVFDFVLGKAASEYLPNSSDFENQEITRRAVAQNAPVVVVLNIA